MINKKINTQTKSLLLMNFNNPFTNIDPDNLIDFKTVEDRLMKGDHIGKFAGRLVVYNSQNLPDNIERLDLSKALQELETLKIKHPNFHANNHLLTIQHTIVNRFENKLSTKIHRIFSPFFTGKAHNVQAVDQWQSKNKLITELNQYMDNITINPIVQENLNRIIAIVQEGQITQEDLPRRKDWILEITQQINILKLVKSQEQHELIKSHEKLKELLEFNQNKDLFS